MPESTDNKSTNETLNLNTITNLIPEFDTNRVSEVYRFVRSCDVAFTLAPISQHMFLLIYTLNRIVGPGASDVHSKQFSLWSQLKTFLIEKFSNVKTLSHLNLELQAMFQKPNESITDYYHRVDLSRSKIIEKITTEINNETLPGRKACTEEMALNVFINGLSSDIGTMLRTKEFTSLPDAARFAMQEEKIRRMNEARQFLHKINLSKPRPDIKTIQRPSTSFNNVSKYPPYQNKQQLVIPLSQSSEKLCNYCKKSGHIISECRKRAYNNSMRNPKDPPPLNQKINHLNSQAAVEPGTSTETAINHQNRPQELTPTFEDLHLDQ